MLIGYAFGVVGEGLLLEIKFSAFWARYGLFFSHGVHCCRQSILFAWADLRLSGFRDVSVAVKADIVLDNEFGCLNCEREEKIKVRFF